MNTNLWNVWIKYRQVTTDSRKAVKGQIFVALKGERFNGNDFALQALEQDAEAVVVDEDIPGAAKNDKLIRVDDSLKALQDLAREWRKTFSIPVIGISGSNGKTTTKELLRSVLSTTFKVHSTKGNLNNHIGVPLTLLDLEESHQISIVEMGANKPKDIQEVASFALPTAGLMTNVGFTHLDGMGSLDGVEETEGELFAFLRAHGGKGFVNEEDFRVVRQAQALLYPLTFGGPHSDFQILTQKDTESGMHLKISSKYWKNEIAFSSVMTGRHNALNILAAVSVATHFGVSAESLVAGVRDYVPSNNRSQWVEKPGKRIMLDAYNANPSSMQASVKAFLGLKPANAALILGDMFELGEMSAELHAETGKFLNDFPGVKLILIGPEMKAAAGNCALPSTWFSSTDEAREKISTVLKDSQNILIKGSRGMALERLLDFI